MSAHDIARTEVVIIGSGFGALAAAKKLATAGTDFVLISDTTEHLFQPLLYQVATGVLSAAEIAPPVRAILAGYPGADVRLGRAVDIDPEAGVLTYQSSGRLRRIGYDRLIVATGARQAYFGRDEFAEHTFALKTVDDAEALRRQILGCFEHAHTTDDPDRRKELLTFLVIGAGPTGVELAGQIMELAQRYFAAAVAGLSAADVTVRLIEGADEALPAFGGRLSDYTRRSLERGGVEVDLGSFVTEIGDGYATVTDSRTGAAEQVRAQTVIWSAGVQANDFAAVLAARTDCATDRAGRLKVNPDLTVGARADVFAVGDMIALDGVPGQSPAAMQGGRHVARTILRRQPQGTPFRYRDKGSMAIINRGRAIARIGRIELTGLIGWLSWLVVHLAYMVGFRNRMIAVVSWVGSFLGHKRPHFHLAMSEPEVPAARELTDRAETAAAAPETAAPALGGDDRQVA